MKKPLNWVVILVVSVVALSLLWVARRDGSARGVSHAPANLSVPTSVSDRSEPPESGRLGSIPSRSKGVAEVIAAPADKRVAFLVGKIGDGSSETRYAALSLLGTRLTPLEVEEMLSFVAADDNLPNFTELNSAALKNDTLNALRNQQLPPANLTKVLLKMVNDSQQPQVMQDYALQHLTSWYEEGASPQDKPALVAALKVASQSGRGSLPGTSLIALARLTPSESPEYQEVQQLALQQVRASQSNPMTLTTALQVCSSLHVHEAYPVAKKLAADPQAPMPVRISAIAAVGDLGGAADEALLQSWATGGEMRLRLPASSALKRMNSRLGL